MQSFRLLGEVTHQFGLTEYLLVIAEVLVFQFGDLGTHIGHHEEVGVVIGGAQGVDTFFGEVDGIEFLIDDEEKLIIDEVHVLTTVLHVEAFGFLKQGLHAFLAKELDEGVALGQAAIGTEQQVGAMALLLVGGSRVGENLLGFGQDAGDQAFLVVEQADHIGLELVELLQVAAWGRTTDDQRSTGIVDQHGVDLVDDGVVMSTLHEIGRRDGHVITQIVETELVVGTESDICLISLTTGFGVGLVLIDTVDRETMEHVERTHPLGVTLGQIVVDGYDMNTVACEGVEEHGEGGHEGLTFTSSHLSNLSLMEYDTTKQLYVVVDHFPFQVVTTCSPVVMVDGLVAIDSDKVLTGIGCQLTVEVGSGDDGFFVFCKATGGLLHDGEHLEHHFVEGLLVNLQHFLLDLIDLCEDVCTLIDRRVLDGSLQFGNLCFLLCGRRLYLLLQLLCTLTELVIAHGFDLWGKGFCLLHERLNQFHVA